MTAEADLAAPEDSNFVIITAIKNMISSDCIKMNYMPFYGSRYAKYKFLILLYFLMTRGIIFVKINSANGSHSVLY